MLSTQHSNFLHHQWYSLNCPGWQCQQLVCYWFSIIIFWLGVCLKKVIIRCSHFLGNTRESNVKIITAYKVSPPKANLCGGCTYMWGPRLFVDLALFNEKSLSFTDSETSSVSVEPMKLDPKVEAVAAEVSQLPYRRSVRQVIKQIAASVSILLSFIPFSI